MQSLKTLGIATILLGFGLSAAAQEVVVIPPTTAPADIVGAYDTLPPGNKSIAESLYNAQTGPTYWTRDQIATAKMSGDGWGEIFHEMKRDGLITEKSLGQVIRRDASAPAALHHSGSSLSSRPHREIIVTTASGASRVVGIGNGHASRGTGTTSTLTTGKGSHGASAASSALGGGFAAGHSGGQGGGHGNGHGKGR